VRSNPKGRQAKSKARLARFEELQSQEFQTRNETNEIYIPPGPRLGDLVIEANGLQKAFGDRLLFEDVSFSLPKGGIVGIIGANGAGKTTLFKMLTGHETAGRRRGRVGETVQFWPTSTRAATRSTTRKPCGKEISDGQDIIRIGN
jgi:sulfate-transporting ATPase